MSSRHLVCRGRLIRAAWTLIFLVAGAAASDAQLRIVSYNTTTADPEGGVTTARPGLDVVLESIGEEARNGVAKPIDVLLLQEQYTMDTSTQSIVDLLNGIYGTAENPAPYARGTVNGATSDSQARGGRPGIVYNTLTVELVHEIPLGVVSFSQQPRSTLRYQLRPVGYDSAADLYVYNSHYKAGTTQNDEDRRQIEANAIRTHGTYGSNALGDGAHAIYAGDLNLYRSTEPAFQTLVASGAGQAFDPVSRVGSWTGNSSFADVHTQSPCLLSGCIGAIGGMDDRFDFQLVTGEFLDSEGLSYIPGSYRAFGNNGTTFDRDINNGSNTYVFNGVTSHTRNQILNALRSAADHLPVVADYQLPAVMHVVAGTVPVTLTLGQEFQLDVMVSNAANVAAAIGADELDYSLTTSGALSGSFLNQVELALGGGNTHLVAFDTSTLGMKTGTISVSSTSQAVQNGSLSIPISFEVVASALAGDYNSDGAVDAADYVVWRKTGGTPTGYEAWRANFGATSATAGAAISAAVPEPNGSVLLAMGGCLAALRRGKLRAWSRKLSTSIWTAAAVADFPR